MRASTVGLAIFQPFRCRIGSTAPSVAGSRNLFACQLAASGPCLRLAVADHAGDEQIRVVERRAVGMAERVAELAALVNRSRRLGRDVARHPARERELPEELLHARRVLRDRRPVLRVGALEPRARAHRRAAVPGPGDEQGVRVVQPDEPVDMCVEQIEAGRRSPVAEQARLDVLGAQGLAQQRVGEQVDLPDREVVRRAPPGVDVRELLRGERSAVIGSLVGFIDRLLAAKSGVRSRSGFLRTARQCRWNDAWCVKRRARRRM